MVNGLTVTADVDTYVHCRIVATSDPDPVRRETARCMAKRAWSCMNGIERDEAVRRLMDHHRKRNTSAVN